MKNILFILLAAVLFPCVAFSTPDEFNSPINSGHLPKLMYRAINLVDSKMKEAPPESYEWEWTGAVLMIGVADMYDYTKDPKYLDFVKRWIDFHIARGYTLSKSDQIVPGYLLLKLYENTGEIKYLDHAKRIGKYLTEEAPRTSEGGLLHFGPVGSKSLWIDSLFMLNPFLIELSRITHDDKFIKEAVKQNLLVYSHLQDNRTGLCRHFWEETKNKTNDAYWLRGNSWALASTAILLGALPENYNAADRAKVIDHFRKHARAIVSHQGQDGMWHTVIDDRDAYIESSGTALVAFALRKGVMAKALDAGYLHAADLAMRGLMDYVEIHPDGFCTMRDVSLGTRPGNSNYYKNVELAENVPYGVGAYAMAVTDLLAGKLYRYDPAIMSVEDGWEELRWGRVSQARKIMTEISNDGTGAADFGAGFTIFIDTVVKFYEAFTDMSVSARGATPEKFRAALVSEFAPEFAKASDRFALVETRRGFTQITERATFLGGTSVGYVQWSAAEIYFFHALAKFAEGFCYFVGSYNIDAPPLLLAKRQFGEIVRDPAYPDFLKLNDHSGELLPKSRSAFAEAFALFKAMVVEINTRDGNYPECIFTSDTLKLRGTFELPGLIEPQPTAALVSKNKALQIVLKHLARNAPETLPLKFDKARKSILEGEPIPLSKEVGLNLSAPFERPQNLRDFFPIRHADGAVSFPDPTFGGLLPGMTAEKMEKISKYLGIGK